MRIHDSPETVPFSVSASLMTDAGCVHTINQDCCQVVQPSAEDLLARKGVLIVVADGMGGAQAGEVASRVAVQTVARAYYSSSADPQEALAEAFQNANSEMYQFSRLRKEFNGMGSTCTALVIHSRFAYSAHVGDTRLYLVRSGSIYQMTEDHSVVTELIKKGAITPEAARRDVNRSVLLRAMGTRPSVEIATWERPLPVHAGDRFVLCSDGLHNLVTDEEICAVAGSGDACGACESLVAMARQRGGHDNITAAIASVQV